MIPQVLQRFSHYIGQKETVKYKTQWFFHLAGVLKKRNKKTYLFSHSTQEDLTLILINGHLMLASLYWKFKTDRSKNTLLLPLYYQRLGYKSYDTTRFSTVFPLYWSYTNMLGKRKVFFPLIWTSKTRYISLLLLFRCFRQEDLLLALRNI
ncbi:MAG: hypothetical protein HC831_18710 [Chloroflexia bacterium]|nr:hypothetical protein [Chloroflexia bacterium]